MAPAMIEAAAPRPATDRWRRPGCGRDCLPGRHDPVPHEAHGLLMAITLTRPRVVATGPLTVDLANEQAFVHGEPVHLSGREWAVLAHLAERLGRRCTAEQVVTAVWGSEWLEIPIRRHGRFISSGANSMRSVMARLRARLGDAGGLIVSHQGAAGYRLLRCPETD